MSNCQFIPLSNMKITMCRTDYLIPVYLIPFSVVVINAQDCKMLANVHGFPDIVVRRR
jgi:hypothetical protein